VRRSFKTECETLAASVRSELDLDICDPLDPRRLAAHLGIPMHPVSSLRGEGIPAAVQHVMTEDRSAFSAMTIFPQWPRHRRTIIFNDGKSPARQNSDLAHELSHALLLHEPRIAIVNGRRHYNKTEEDEAAWLSGCLLIPRVAALRAATAGTTTATVAATYGVSTDMVVWRMNCTGATKQADSSRTRLGPNPRA